jgi:hypothetical protein
MNSHLNIFKTYAKENRRYQLENDLTRALAICMQEDALFFNEVLGTILNTQYSRELFSDLDSMNEVSINIQKNSNEIRDFEKIFAVSLSEHVMTEDHFWKQNHEVLYDPICDIVININKVLIIIEAKRDNVDCTAQLYNQVFNICQKNEIPSEEWINNVEPKDLNWPLLMEIAVRVYGIEKATGSPNRFLKDFIDLVKDHNFRWLPEPSIFSVSSDNTGAIRRRIQSAINELCKTGNYRKLDYYDRLGIAFNRPWAQEILFGVNKNGDLDISIYPGNTKAQGSFIFLNDPQLRSHIEINGSKYELQVNYHVKFTSFRKYFSGLWFSDNDLKSKIYTTHNFQRYTGRNKRGTNWESIESLFDSCFKDEYDWRGECGWDSDLYSGKSQFDMSFGYELSVTIPFKVLKEKDRVKSDLSGLVNLIQSVYSEFETIYTV